MELTEREQKVLFHVIDEFIQTGEPVASAAVARKDAINLSSATVRNVMGGLEQAGYLVQPHTSAGRVPTAGGMRQYVDLLARYAVATQPRLALGPPIEEPPHEDPRGIARWATTVLADLSELAGLVLGPEPGKKRIHDVRLVALGSHRVLSIFVEDSGSTVERITTFEEAVTPSDLTLMQNYLTEIGRGRTLAELRKRVRAELTETRGQYRRFITHALAVAHDVGIEQKSDLHVEGAFRFVELGDDMERISGILRALEEKERVIQILDQVWDARSPVAIIGPESGWDLADDLSFVICGYYRGSDRAGLVGVLGPMRMDYSRVIPLVDHVARVLSTELETSA